MPLIVQKYGGSSVATPERIAAVAQRVLARKAELPPNFGIAVVVSAMGDTTDQLLAQANALHRYPASRELDLLLSTGEVAAAALLALALQAADQPARALTGGQAGIRTNSAFGRASIASLAPERVERAVAAGEIPVVAGFQGVIAEEHGEEVTTLGRGGSDTTAVALAVATGALWCEICTDVDGIYTADPRLVPQARRLACITPLEMLELAQQGARVMHPRAVELGGFYSMPILVCSSFNNHPGTWIKPRESVLPPVPGIAWGERQACREGFAGLWQEQEKKKKKEKEPSMELHNKVSGIAHDSNVAKLTVLGLPEPEFAVSKLFAQLARAGINIDAISHSAEPGEHRAKCAFTVSQDDLPAAVQITEETAAALGALGVHYTRSVGKVSVIGLGVQDTPGLASTAFTALVSAGIGIDMVTTSQIRITCLVPEERLEEAVGLLHAAFGLGEDDAAPYIGDGIAVSDPVFIAAE